MKYILIGILLWIAFFVMFTGIGLIFTITEGMYNKDDIYICIEGGALLSTSLIIVGCVLCGVFPAIMYILGYK